VTRTYKAVAPTPNARVSTTHRRFWAGLFRAPRRGRRALFRFRVLGTAINHSK
jgi:hypothetical protein